MFAKYRLVKIVALLVISSLIAACAGGPDTTGPSAEPAPTAIIATDVSVSVQPKQSGQMMPQASPIPTPPINTPIPPVSYEKDGNIEIWSLTNEHISENDIYAASALGLVLVVADGPLPVGDVVALVVVGGTLIIYAIQVAPEVIKTVSNAIEDITVLMAKDPNNINVPPIPAGMPEFPPHIRDGNHPAGPFAARWKQVAWITVFTAFLNGNKPDWCGRRENDGALMVVYYSLTISTKIGGKVYTGLALLLNQGGAHQSTAFKDVAQKPDGSPDTCNSSGNDCDQFVPFTCPGPDGLKPITQ